MRPQRLLSRSVWLALPVDAGAAGARGAANIWRPWPALLAWLLGLVLSGALAWLRERRLEATGRYLEALAEGREPAPLPEFGPLGGDELATALHRLDRALAEQRERRAETDRLLRDAARRAARPVAAGRRASASWSAPTRPPKRCSATSRCDRPIEAACAIPGCSRRSTRRSRATARPSSRSSCRGRRSRAFGVLVVPVRLRRQAAALIGLRELTEQLMIERMRSDFVANASHELRTPLAALRGFIDTLAGPARDDPEARERFLKTMAAEAARMSRLVDDLLSLSRIEQTEHQPPSERVDLVDCLESGGAQPCGRYAAGAQRHARACSWPEPLPAVARPIATSWSSC